MRPFLLAVTVLSALGARLRPSPPDERWLSLRCGNAVMTDPFHDEPGAQAERDLVGEPTRATGMISADRDFLYLRMRLDENAIVSGSPRPFAWGILLDTDGRLSTYEVLIHANGLGEIVSLYKNSTTTLPNDPSDPPDEPAVKTYPMSTHTRTIVAPGTNFGSNDDYFLEVAVPWANLQRLGVGSLTPVVAWAATSSNSTTLDGDLACWDNGMGRPRLSETGSRRGSIDPRADSDGDGFTDLTEGRAGTDPTDITSRPDGPPDAEVLAGGGGCQSLPLTMSLFASVWLFLARRRQLTRPARTRC